MNGWNWFSLNVEMENMTLNDIFVNTEVANSDNIKNQTTQSTYYGSPNFTWYPNFNMNVENHYQFNSSLGGEIIYYGDYLEPSENPIDIVDGWNWIGFCPPYSLNILDALETVTLQEGDIIKSQTSLAMYYDYAGGTWYPEIIMEPTQGYMLKVANPSTLIYPPESRSNHSFVENSITFEHNSFVLIQSKDLLPVVFAAISEMITSKF